MGKNRDVIQVKNPKSGHYVKIDRSEGGIIDHKKVKARAKEFQLQEVHRQRVRKNNILSPD